MTLTLKTKFSFDPGRFVTAAFLMLMTIVFNVASVDKADSQDLRKYLEWPKYYGLVSDLHESYFRNDPDSAIAVIDRQKSKVVATPTSDSQIITAANYWLANMRFFRLLGDRSKVESSLKQVRQHIDALADKSISPFVQAHASLESAETDILLGVPANALRELGNIPEEILQKSVKISARVHSAYSAISLQLADRHLAFKQSGKAVSLFQQDNDTSSDYLLAKSRQLAANYRLDAPRSQKEIEAFVAGFVTGKTDRVMLLAELYHTVGIMAFGENQAAQSANIFSQVLNNAQLSQTHPLAFSARLALIGSDLLVGKNADALRNGLGFLNIFGEQSPPNSIMTADLYMQIAGSLLIVGDKENAQKLALASLQVSQLVAPQDSAYHRLKLLDAADVFSQLGELKTAAKFLVQSRLSELGEMTGIGHSLVYMKTAKIFERLNDPKNSERAYGYAYEYLGENPISTVINFTVLESYSAAMFKLGRQAEALDTTRMAVRILREVVARETAELGLQQFDPAKSLRIRSMRSGNQTVINRLLLLLSELPRDDQTRAVRNEAFVAAQFGNGSKIEDVLTKVAARAAGGNAQLSQLLRKKQDLNVQLSEANRALAFLAFDPITTAGTKPEEIKSTVNSLKSDLALLEKTIRTKFPKASTASAIPLLSLDDVQDQLTDEDAVLYYHETHARLLLWVVTKEDDRFLTLPVDANVLLDQVNDIRQALNAPTATRSSTQRSGEDVEITTLAPFDRSLSYQLYQSLLAPVSDIVTRKRNLYISANGALTALPFSLLVTQKPTGSDISSTNLRKTHWLVNSHATVTLPSISYLSFAANDNRATDRNKRLPASFIGFGNPSFSGETTTTEDNNQAAGRSELINMLNGLAELPDSERELLALAKIFNTDAQSLFLADDATETNLKRAELSGKSVLAFATHAVVSNEIPQVKEPALIMTPPAVASEIDDGIVTASELALLNIEADWLILSACNTAASDGTAGGQGLSGLASAGLYAGAKSLLVSHWPVLDMAAADLTTRTLGNYFPDRKITRAEALRLAMVDMIGDETIAEYAHPAAWAPFVLVGGLQ